ncbi:MAG: putative C-S lyase [Betaproteobacteria bacterium]|nr:MAG: putative C-S lyase [Betaproteobacteria bacterium]
MADANAFDFDSPVERAGTWSMRWERYAGRDVIPLWVADSDFRAPPAVLEALAARVEHGVFGYTVAPDELRQAIVERVQRLYRWPIEPAWIVFLPGVVPGLHLAARRLVPPDGHLLVPTPVYQHLKRAAELAPRAHSDIPLVLREGRWVFDEETLKRSLRPESRLFFLCNPHNPGGTVFRRAELERLAGLTRDLIIVSDEIHCDLVLESGLAHLPIASLAREVSRRTVTLMSASKTFNFPAAGCAWAIIEDEALRREFSADVHAHVLHSPSVFGYVATLAAFRHGDAWLAAQLEYLRGNRDQVERRLGLPMAHVEATYLAWIDCSGLGVENAYDCFLRHGVALSPGAQFGDARFVRFNFATQRARLDAALARMRAAVERRAPR